MHCLGGVVTSNLYKTRPEEVALRRRGSCLQAIPDAAILAAWQGSFRL